MVGLSVARVVTWAVTASEACETARAGLGRDALRARGRGVGPLPEPYWITYGLETAGGFVARRPALTAEDASGSRSLDLRHDGRGGWSADGERLPAPGGGPGLCPLTDTVPVPRHGLLRGPGEREFVRYASDLSSDPEFGEDGRVVACSRPARRLGTPQRSVTLPSATSRRRVTWTASSMRRSWVISRSVPW